jgi:hypothetical protein
MNMAAVCNRDCFNCQYEDCIVDDMTLAEYAESRKRELTMHKTPEQKRIAAKQKAYYEANRDEIAAKQKAYYEANREAYNAYMRDYLRRKRAEKRQTA